jgi:hypothetical protein
MPSQSLSCAAAAVAKALPLTLTTRGHVPPSGGADHEACALRSAPHARLRHASRILGHGAEVPLGNMCDLR